MPLNEEQLELLEHLIVRDYIDQEDDQGWLFTKVYGDWIEQALLDEMSSEKREENEDRTYCRAFNNKVPGNFYILMLTAFKNLGLTLLPEDDAWQINREPA
jgi:hypothetical protein